MRLDDRRRRRRRHQHPPHAATNRRRIISVATHAEVCRDTRVGIRAPRAPSWNDFKEEELVAVAPDGACSGAAPAGLVSPAARQSVIAVKMGGVLAGNGVASGGVTPGTCARSVTNGTPRSRCALPLPSLWSSVVFWEDEDKIRQRFGQPMMPYSTGASTSSETDLDGVSSTAQESLRPVALYARQILPLYGLCDKMISDRNPRVMMSKYFEARRVPCRIGISRPGSPELNS